MRGPRAQHGYVQSAYLVPGIRAATGAGVMCWATHSLMVPLHVPKKWAQGLAERQSLCVKAKMPSSQAYVTACRDITI